MKLYFTAEFIIHINAAACMQTKTRWRRKGFQGDPLHHIDECLFHPLLNQLQRAVNGAHSLKRSARTSPFNRREREYRQVYLVDFAGTLKGNRSPIKSSSTF